MQVVSHVKAMPLVALSCAVQTSESNFYHAHHFTFTSNVMCLISSHVTCQSNAISGTELRRGNKWIKLLPCVIILHVPCHSHQMLCDISSHVTRQSNDISGTELLVQTSESNCYKRQCHVLSFQMSHVTIKCYMTYQVTSHVKATPSVSRLVSGQVISDNIAAAWLMSRFIFKVVYIVLLNAGSMSPYWGCQPRHERMTGIRSRFWLNCSHFLSPVNWVGSHFSQHRWQKVRLVKNQEGQRTGDVHCKLPLTWIFALQWLRFWKRENQKIKSFKRRGADRWPMIGFGSGRWPESVT